MYRIVTPAIMALTFSVSVHPAFAEEKTVRVGYSDLDLSSDIAAAQLEGRIRAALRKVCGDPEHRNIKIAQSRQECRESARRSAYGQLADLSDEDQRATIAQALNRNGRR